MNDEDRLAKLIKYELFRTIPCYSLTGLSGQPLASPVRFKLQIQLQKLQITNMLRDNSIINTLFAGVVWYLKQSF